LSAEIERNRERSAGMLVGIADEQPRVSKLVTRAKGDWAKDVEPHLADRAAAYRASIVAMQEARADLFEQVQTGAWLSAFPETGRMVPTPRFRVMRLAGRPP
jgi:hypothetical protein